MRITDMTPEQLQVKKAELSAKAMSYAHKRDKTRSLLERKKNEIYRRSTCEQIGKIQELLKDSIKNSSCKSEILNNL